MEKFVIGIVNLLKSLLMAIQVTKIVLCGMQKEKY